MTYLDLVDIVPPFIKEEKLTLTGKTVLVSSTKAIPSFVRVKKRKNRTKAISFYSIYWSLKFLITKQQRQFRSFG